MTDETLDPHPAPKPPSFPRSIPDRWRAWHRLGLLALVAAGGTVGTGVRAVLDAGVGTEPPSWPWVTLAVNVSGALVLGFLLEVLDHAGADSGRRRRVRLAVGTGLLGGYTTYSTFAIEVVQLTQVAPHLGVGYAAASLVLGPVAAAAGYLAALRVGRSAADGRPA